MEQEDGNQPAPTIQLEIPTAPAAANDATGSTLDCAPSHPVGSSDRRFDVREESQAAVALDVLNGRAELKDQVFANRKTATRFVKDLALAMGKQARVDSKRNGSHNYTMVCTSSTPCPFFISLVLSSGTNVKGFHVSSHDLRHVGCSSVAKPTAKQAASLASARVAVTANPRIAAKSLMAEVQMTDGISVPVRMAYRVKTALDLEKEGGYVEGYQLIESLLRVFCEKNEGAHHDIFFNADGRLERAFLSNPYNTSHQENGQKILGADGTFMKHKRYRSTMLVMVGRDGNNGNVMLAVALCRSESSDNCIWFFDQCSRAGIQINGVPVFTDRGKSLMAALNEYKTAITRFCTQHILRNVRHHFRAQVSPVVERRLWDIQGAETAADFDEKLKELEKTHPTIGQYLREIDGTKWALYSCVGGARLYGWRTTNFVESENNAVLPIRLKHPFAVFEDVIGKFNDSAFAASEDVKKWRQAGLRVTPYAESQFVEQQNLAGFYNARGSSESIVFVEKRQVSDSKTRRVDVSLKTCTCIYYDQFGIPCRHLVAALRLLGKLDILYDFFDHCYYVESFENGYSWTKNKNVELPLHEDLTRNENHLPPLDEVTRGRTRTKRMRSQGENGPRTSKTKTAKQVQPSVPTPSTAGD